MLEKEEEKIRRLSTLGETCRKIIDGEISLFANLNEEDYDFAIGKFIRTKEKSIQKRMGNAKNFYLDFNLDNNKNIIWDMLFLSEVISRQITAPNAIKEILTKMMNVNLIGETYNNETLTKEESNKLKKSVVIYQKTRDSLSHNPNNIISKIEKETNKLIINNPYKNSLLQCEIPFQYIEKFGSGITPIKEHQEIANEIDKITSNIFFKLGFEMKEIPNFIYRTHPSRIKILLEKSNGEISILKELPSYIYKSSCSDEKICYLLKKLSNDFNKIKELPFPIFEEETKIERIEYILNKLNNNIENLKYIPEEIFYYSCKQERIEFLFKIVNSDVTKLKYIPEEAFSDICPETRINYFLNKVNNDVEKLENLQYVFFIDSYQEKYIDYLLDKVNNDIEQLKKLPDNLIRSNIMKIEYIFKITNSNYELMKNLPQYIYSTDCSIERIDYLLKKTKGKIEKIFEIPSFILSNEFSNSSTEQLIKIINNDIDNLQLFRKNKNYIIYNIENIEHVMKKINIGVEELKIIPDVIYSDKCDIKKIDYLLKKVNNNINKFSLLPEPVFCEEVSEEKIDYLLSFVNNNIENLKEIPYIFYYQECSIERIKYIMEKINYDIEYLKNIELPEMIFFDECKQERIEYLLSLVSERIEKLKYIPYIFFDKRCKQERIELFLKKTKGNIEKIEELPAELFTCNDEIFEELYNTYEMNMIKSIFGIGDEKLITLMVYMNTVFSNYQEEIKDKTVDISKLNIDTIPKKIKDKSEVLEKKVTETNNRKKNLKELTIKQEAKSTIGATIGAIKQIPSEEKIEKDITEINNEFIRLIGNSSRHFRIYKQDDNTIVLEDYTKDEEGNIKLAFRATSTIKELFNITSSLVSNNMPNNLNEEIVQKINISNPDKYTNEQLEKVNKDYEQTKIELVKKILIQICLNKREITSIKEIQENNIIYFEYIQPNGIKIKRDLEELYQHFKNIEPNIFNEAIEEYNNYLKDKTIQELEIINSKKLIKKK